MVMENNNRSSQEKKRTRTTETRLSSHSIEGVSMRVDRVLKKYDVATAMRPHSTLRRLLVYPKDKVEPEEQGELIYQIVCKSCVAAYI